MYLKESGALGCSLKQAKQEGHDDAFSIGPRLGALIDVCYLVRNRVQVYFLSLHFYSPTTTFIVEQKTMLFPYMKIPI